MIQNDLQSENYRHICGKFIVFISHHPDGVLSVTNVPGGFPYRPCAGDISRSDLRCPSIRRQAPYGNANLNPVHLPGTSVPSFFRRTHTFPVYLVINNERPKL
jgi:hypothetical protein